MSNQPDKMVIEPSKRSIPPAVCRMVVFMLGLIAAGLFPPTLHGEERNAGPGNRPPLLVSARHDDTLASLAQRYLNDASKGWLIGDYNGLTTVSGGQTVLVPMAPFRPGGLTPEGYQTVPVLAYPEIGEVSRQAQRVSRSAFNDQMRWLRTEGFTAISPVQLNDFMSFSSQLPRRPVLITTDTESQAFYDLGVPILKALGFTATVFVATANVGRKDAMTWDQIERLHKDGFTIACRGRSGRTLTRPTQGEALEAYFHSVESELRLAKREIERHLGAPCLFLAYPHGGVNNLVSAMAAKLGYSAAFILQPGDNPFFADRFGIHRSAIDSRTDPEQFAKLLTTLIPADLN